MRSKVLASLSLLVFVFVSGYSETNFDPSKLRGPSIFYFYQAGCSECEEKSKVISQFLKRHPEVKIQRFEITERDNCILLERFCETASIPDTERLTVPAVFIGDTCLVGESITLDKLEEIYRKRRNWTKPLVEESKAFNEAERRFKGFTVWVVGLAGLADGLNPCAFATLIFFITYLLMTGHSKRKAIVASSGFISGVFLVYLSIGLGFCKLLKIAGGLSFLRYIMHFGFGGLALVFGILSIRDAWLASKGRHRDMKLQLSTEAKQKIHLRIREYVRSGALAIGAFITGGAVSVVELACTGQIYLPTISLMVSSSESLARPFALLLLYNLMFVLPLIAIAFLSIVAFELKDIKGWLETHTAAFKLLMASAFLLLGIVLVSTVY